jgi:sodium transport system permease protein
MRLNKISSIFRKEVLDTIRDRRTIFTMIIVPLLLYPGLLLFINSLAARQQVKMEQKTIRVALVNIPDQSELAGRVRAEKRIEIVSTTNPSADIRQGNIDFVLRAPDQYEEFLTQNKTTKVEILYDRSNDDAATNLDRVRLIVDNFGRDLLISRLQQKQLSKEFVEPVSVEEINVATKRRMGGFVISRFLPMLMVFMILVGALYPSIDMTAGEKERGTLETILTSPATKTEIVLGKFLTVSLIALITGLLNLGSMMATFAFGIFSSVSEAIQINIPPNYMLVMIVCMIPLAIFFGGVMMAIASFARSFKEAQNLVSPFYLVATIPAMTSSIPGIRLEGFWLTMPIANVVLLFKELMLGILSWPHILVVFFSITFLASVAIFAAIKLFGREEVLFGEASSFGLSFRRSNIAPKRVPDSSEALFFAMMSLAIVIYIGIPLQMRDLIYGLVITELLIFLALPIAFAIYLKLDLRETFRLRIPDTRSLLVTLFLLVGIVLNMGTLLYIQQKLFPFPKELVDFLQKFTEKIYARPVWQALALIALLPAVCEETTFRGLILSGMLSRKKPWVAMVITALFFGIFHLSLHRFPAVFLIGLAACFVVWISGSLFTGILLHALSNGIVTLLATYPKYDFVGIQTMKASPIAILGVVFIVLGTYLGVTWRSTSPASQIAE